MSQLYTPYFPLQLAANLKFIDSNGNPVSQLYPTATTQQLDNPSTGYISLIGSRVSSMIDQYNAVTQILASYNTRITDLETEVDNILASGATAIPAINGGCLNGSTIEPTDTLMEKMVVSYCSYTTVLGTTSALSAGIVALDTSALNTLPAYSQNSAMSGLAGWNSAPTTVGAWMNNISLAYLDARAGISQALNQSNITCSSISINISSSYNPSNRTITLYFPGSYIPSAFADTGSHLAVTDSVGNQFTMNFNAVTAVVENGLLNIDITSSTLLQTSDYTVTFVYELTSTTPSLGCSNTIITSVANSTTICPNVSVWSGSTTTVSFTFVPPITTKVVYAVDLMNVSGTTVLQTKTYTNPSTAIVDTFTGLTTATSYNIRVTTTVAGESTICSLHGITTS